MKQPLKKIFLLFLLCFAIHFACFSQKDTTRGIGNLKEKEKKSWGNIYALVVGISNYKYITQLNYADDDAEAFRDFLISTKVIADPNNIYYLIDSMATSHEIFAALNN